MLKRIFKSLKENHLLSLSLLTLIVLVITSIIAYKNLPHYANTRTDLFLNKIHSDINSVNRINISHKNYSIYLKLLKDKWVVQNKNNYMADINKVRDLVVGTSTMEIIDKKTSKPEKLENLGLSFPGKNSDSTRIQFYTSKSNTPIADFIIGEQKKVGGSVSNDMFFVRDSNENQAWLVKGEFTISTKPLDYIEKNILDIKHTDIKKIIITPPNRKERVYLSKKFQDKKYHLVKENNKKANEDLISKLSKSIENLRAEDVKPKSKIDFSNSTTSSISFDTFSGLRIILHYTNNNDGHWIRLFFKPLVKDDNKKNEATNLNKKLFNWAFKIGEEQAEIFQLKLSDITAK